MNIVVVTGTGTGVGKTVTTAALAACALRSGRRVAVVKPVQTGVRPNAPGALADAKGSGSGTWYITGGIVSCSGSWGAKRSG